MTGGFQTLSTILVAASVTGAKHPGRLPSEIAQDLSTLSDQMFDLEAAKEKAPKWSTERCDACCKGTMRKVELGGEVGACVSSGESSYTESTAPDFVSCSTGKKEEMFKQSLNVFTTDDQCNYKCAYNLVTDGDRCSAFGHENKELPYKAPPDDTGGGGEDAADAGTGEGSADQAGKGWKAAWQGGAGDDDGLSVEEKKMTQRFPKAPLDAIQEALKAASNDGSKAGCELNKKYKGFDSNMKGNKEGNIFDKNQIEECEGFFENAWEWMSGQNV